MTAYTYEYKYQLAQRFAARWQNEKRERAEKDTFWNEFFAIFQLDRYKTATTEYAVRHRKGGTRFADVFWAGRLLCEHKSAGKDLDTAYYQALEYVEEIRRSNENDVPRYIIVSDFATMRLYDEQEQSCVDFPLKDLPEQIKNRNFDFMNGLSHVLKQAEEQANIEAADAVGRLYSAFKQDRNYPEHNLKQFLIRLLFCFFADDTLIFTKNQFEEYLSKYTREDGEDLGGALNRIFDTLNTPPEQRPQKMNAELREFPYVNGRLFEEKLCEFYFDADLRAQLFECARRDWSHISPEIFGNLFQSAMDGVTRSELGAHYTEEVHIVKVVDSLFMDRLRQDFQAARKLAKTKRRQTINELHQFIGNLNFLDPACGCGNFLVVAYRELRKLEDEIIGELFGENQLLDIATMQRVHIGQFHGVEIDEYPAQIAKVAMWLTDHQCNLRTAERFGKHRPSIPLTDSAEIINANALMCDWPKADYIFGNPPFIGRQNAEQKAEQKQIGSAIKNFANVDYVANWYVKAATVMQKNPSVKTAFVSTNSICQGEQVGILWKWLFEQGFEIFFAHRTFQWTSQAANKAAVHCIIVGFALPEEPSVDKYLFDYADIRGLPEKSAVANINGYLMDAPNYFCVKVNQQISGEIKMINGSKVTDGGFLLMSTAEKDALTAAEPLAAQYIRPFLGAEEFINGKQRWCLWFRGVSETKLNHDLKSMPQVRQRLNGVKQMRLASTDKQTKQDAATPHLFQTDRQPESDNYLIIPRVSSETRNFIPIGFADCHIINSDANFSLPHATLYHFGILCSSMHNAFMRVVAGRLESRYRYSNTIVYNNFPFPFSAAQRLPETGKPEAKVLKHIAAIEKAAQAVLSAREFYTAEALRENLPVPTLADLYAADAPFSRLHQAHEALDRAVDAAYQYKGANNDKERSKFLFGLM